METELKVKDFLIDINQINTKPKETKIKTQTKPEYEVILQNDTDFVLHRKTATTDKNFVFLISQRTFYIKDNKTEEVELLNEAKIRKFFQPIYYDRLDILNQVAWWSGSPERMSQRMTDISSNSAMQKMYQYGIYADKGKAKTWNEWFDDNTKLFKYCYDKCKESTTDNKNRFEKILPIAIDIDKKINFNNAKYFIDKFCESNVKMDLYLGYSRTDTSLFFKPFNEYHLDFNRYVDYLTCDLYTQGIVELNNDILNDYVDYLKMQEYLYGKVREKYPKYLKTDHDVMALKHRIYKINENELAFVRIENKHKWLEYNDKTYCIVLPNSAMDIVDEGVNQNHCVASYVDDVVQGNTLIAFMRYTNEPDKSLITIEVKDGEIKQAKGFTNRAVIDEEKEFLIKWAKQKKLHHPWEEK